MSLWVLVPLSFFQLGVGSTMVSICLFGIREFRTSNLFLLD